MKCPHCHQHFDVVAVKKYPRKEYFAIRNTQSGKAKVRTEISKIGICIGTDEHKCNNPVPGRHWRCYDCDREMKKKRNDEYLKRKAVA